MDGARGFTSTNDRDDSILAVNFYRFYTASNPISYVETRSDVLWYWNINRDIVNTMLRPLISASIGQDYIVFFMRFVMILAFGSACFISRGWLQSNVPTAGYSDILIALAVGAIANLLYGVVVSIRLLRGNAAYMFVIGDWIIAGMFTSLATSNPLLVTGMMMILIVQGVFRLGSEWGIIHGIGVITSSIVVFFLEQAIETRETAALIQFYAPELILLLVMLFVCIVWANAFDENNSTKSRRLQQHVKDTTRRLNSMRVRAKALAEMGEILNVTLDYNKILEACLDLGRFSLRDNPKQRLIAMVLVVSNEDEMHVADARGLQHTDLGRIFRGNEGILAECIREARTLIIGENGHDDAELRSFIAFGNIESILVIPLRVEFSTYGVIVYASTEKNAFNEDHVDTMQSLGVQATIALKNSIIVDTLRIEKERLLRIERGMRESLTRDLHDIPTQTMSALAMNLTMIPSIARSTPEKLKEEVESLRGIAMRFVDEMRYVMFTWRPLSLENQGLGVSLDQLAIKMQQTYKQPLHVQVEAKAIGYLNEEQQSGLFYLIEEACNNARKHAQANMIRVKVSLEGQRVITRIADNGKGFDVSKVTSNYSNGNSYGMINMSDRAEHIKGTLDLRSEFGKGTTITVVIPVELTSATKAVKKDNRKAFARPQETTAPRTGSGPMSPVS